MLFKLKQENKCWSDLTPMPFMDASNLGKREKDLENLIVDHLLDVLGFFFSTGPVISSVR